MRVAVAVGWTNAMVGGGVGNAVTLDGGSSAEVGTGTSITGDSPTAWTALVVVIGCACGDCDTAVDSGVAARDWAVGGPSGIPGRVATSLVQATNKAAAIAANVATNLALPIHPL